MISRGVVARMKLGDRHIASFSCQTFEQAKEWIEKEKEKSVLTFEIDQWEETRTTLHREKAR